MSKRNVAWLIVIAGSGVLGWLVGGWLVAVLAALGALVVSEVVERQRRRRRLAASGRSAPSVRDAVTRRRTKR